MSEGRESLTNRLHRQLAHLDSYVSLAGQNNLTSSHVVAESTTAGLLNRIYGWELINANTAMQNCPSVDLVDERNRIAVQVTATRTLEKVRHTLEEVGKRGVVYDELIILLLTHDQPTQGMIECTVPSYSGPMKVWNLGDLLRDAKELDVLRLGGLTEFLEAELGGIRERVKDLPHLELPPLSALPTTGFVGREQELAEIRSRFANGDKLVVLTGLGGMGKTELAVRYARSYPGLVHFVRFDTDFTHTLAGMAQGIRPRLPDGELSRDEAALAEKVLSLLAGADENDLLILDNADSKTGVLEDLLCDPVFERISKLKLLLTTRSAWDDAIRVEPMPEEPLFGIFRRHGAKATEQEKKDLIDAVGGHTLTIDLIARTLNGRGWRKVTAGMLLEDLRRHSLPEKKYRDVATHYDQSPGQAQIYQHLSVVFDVSGMSDPDHAVLRCGSLLPEGGMDTELFGCSLGDEEQDALGLLLERGWLERKDDLLTIHPIIRLVCLTELKPTDESCGGFLKTLIGQYDETKFQLEPCRQIARLLSNASDTLADERGQWALEAGERWRDVGAYSQAHAYSLRAMERMEANLSPDTPELAQAYNNVGCTYGDLGDHRMELDYQLKSLDIRERVFPADHPDLAQSYNNVGTTYGELGNHRKALEFKQKALTIREKVLPPEHPGLAVSYNNVGGTYGELGDHRKALEYQQKALTIWEKVLPPEHPDLARSYNNVGVTYGELGDHWKELEYLQKALTIRKKVLPPEHPNLAMSYNNIAWTYHELGNLPAAARSMRLAADIISRSALPMTHPNRLNYPQWADRFETEARMQQDMMMKLQQLPFPKK